MKQQIRSPKPHPHEVAPLSESPHTNPRTVYILYSVLTDVYTVKFVCKDYAKASLEKTKQESMSKDSLTKWGIAEAPLLL